MGLLDFTRSGWMANATPRSHYSRERHLVPILQEAGWAVGPVWTGVENHAQTGICFPESPARSKSLHRLRSPDPQLLCVCHYSNYASSVTTNAHTDYCLLKQINGTANS
jgi:hypothetical protein